MKKITLLLLATLMAFGYSNGQQTLRMTVQPAPTQGAAQEYETDRITVKFRIGFIPVFTERNGKVESGIPAIDALIARYPLTKAVRIDAGRKSKDQMYSLRFDGNIDVMGAVKDYQQTGVLDFAEPDYKEGIFTTTPNDPYFVYQWGSFNNGSFAYGSVSPTAGRDIDMKLAWDITQGSSSVVVAVIDAGARMDHPEFSGRVWTNTDEIAGNGIDDDANGFIDDRLGWNFSYNTNDPTDDHGHGTNVAGIIGANGNNSVGYAGIDWNCKLMMLKALNSAGSGNTGLTSSAIYYATDNGAKVINMSLGGAGYSAALQTAIDYAYANGVTCVAAMGNDNTSTPFYPAAMNHIIAVGATRCNDTRATFSNFGSHISVVAPGEAIFGLYYASSTDYTHGMSGTSQACPHVAGVAALLLAQNGTRTHDQIKAILQGSAEDQVGSASEDIAGFDNYYGYGRINAYAALTYSASCSLPAIGGTKTVCIGATTTLSNATAGGTWMSGSTATATIGSTTGVVTGVAAGTANVTYTVGVCTVTATVTVNALPNAITGSGTVCVGRTTTLASSTSGGTWTSSTTAVATVVSSTGVVTGVAAGTSRITYSVTATGCTRTSVVTVNALPNAITGATTVCAGAGTTLASTTTGGTWTSSNTAVATVGSTNGVVTGVTAGTAVITYTITSTGCNRTVTVTVTTGSGGISGSTSVCVSSTITLTNATSGGTWSSSSTGIASVNSTTGVVTGMAAGAATITYTTSCGTVVHSITVNVNPGITGTASTCIGAATTLSSTISGGTWTSGTTSVATVGSGTGIVTGVATGTSIVTYTLATGCRAIVIATVNTLPAAITGGMGVCTGGTATLASTTSGGTWSSSNAAVATIGATTGIVTGVASGTATISYTIATGCRVTTVVTVGATAAISGTLTACVGAAATLSNATSGGTWTSSMASIATVGSATGVVTGVAAGTATITYTVSGGCRTTSVVTINANPATLTGTATVCAGSNTTFASTTMGGTWSSSNMSVATVGTSGIITGVAAGVSTITYTLSTGCFAVRTVSVNPLPTAITGASAVCAGFTITLTNATSGGTWASSNTAIATVGTSGIVTGVAGGNVTISYTLSTGCRVTSIVTVNANPAAITGTTSACEGATATLADATTGGTWSSSDAAVATVGTSGIFTGVAAGTATITYMLGTGCYRTITVTINAAPPAITGTLSACAGSMSTLANATAGGTWTSSSTSIATIGATTGVVTAVAAGTTTISYSLAGGCRTTSVFTVNALPAAITGTAVVCVGSITTLANATTGGVWSSSNTAIATIGTSGIVSGIATGTTTITYTLGTGCSRTITVTVTATPDAITGTAAVCVGLTTSLSNTVTGGTWTSSAATIASVGASTGVVTGVAAGTSTITYTISSGCRVFKVVTVNALPAAITGTLTMCAGSSTTLANTSAGGTWMSGNTSVATIGASGIVTGVAAGTSTITYTLATGCLRTTTVTVNALPVTIGGTMTVCPGTTTSLYTGVPGAETIFNYIGSRQSYTVPAGVTKLNVVLKGGHGGVGNTAPGGAGGSTSATISVTPGQTLYVNVGGGGANGSGYAGGGYNGFNGGGSLEASGGAGYNGGGGGGASDIRTDSTMLTSRLIVAGGGGGGGHAGGDGGAGGGLTGGDALSLAGIIPATGGSQSAGGSGETDSVTSGLPGTSGNGGDILCFYCGGGGGGGYYGGGAGGGGTYSGGGGAGGSSYANASAAAGIVMTQGTNTDDNGMVSIVPLMTTGTWTSSIPGVASVSSAGVVSGVAAGTTTISFTLTTGCRTTTIVTVNALPAPIGGTLKVCPGFTTTLTNASTGGSWTTSNSSIATIGSATGVASGVAAGTVTVTYTLPTGCIRTGILTVNPTPSAIAGTASTCIGRTTTLSNTGGGTWASSTTSVATITSTGIVTGLTAGTTTITYTLSTGCYITTVVTVNALPPAITGTGTVCAGSTLTLANAETGGTWASAMMTIATVGSSDGVVSGVSAGTARITYTAPTGCFATAIVTVTALQPITGSTIVCVGFTTTLADATTGGTWSSSDASVATIGTSGVVTGVTAGTTTITYTISSGCLRTVIMTVSPVPGAVTGTLTVCVGATASLGNSVSGGTWSSSATAVASIGATSGVATGVASGTATITYAISGGCRSTAVITVNGVPAAIGGTASVCQGATTTLSNTVSGGTWTSTDGSVATVGSSNGIVTGVASGFATISYTLSTGCYRIIQVSVNPTPVAISGTLTVCVGAASSLSNATTGGTWVSSNTSVATIGSATGVLTGVNAGMANITYTVSGCRTISAATVNPSPAAITGTAQTCVGSVASLANATTGGSWASSNPSIASVGSGTGLVTGVAEGTATISYILPAGCYSTVVFTVNPWPGPVAGNATVCVGGTTALGHSVSGGTWSSSNTSIITVGLTSGIVTGISEGTGSITYTTPIGCMLVTGALVKATPGAITGPANVMEGNTITLSNATSGGTWSSSNTARATVGSSDGIVAGVSAGTVTISYTLSSGCYATAAITVSAASTDITGTLTVCEGSTTALGNSVSGGTWSSGSSNATVDATTGVVTGVSAGTAVITYEFPTSGMATAVVTVNALPSAITGPFAVCVGSTATLSNATSGGTWSSSNLSAFTVGSATGIITAVSGGTSAIEYTLSTGCSVSYGVVANSLPTFTGDATVTVGSTTTLNPSSGGGTWNSGNTARATVDAIGVVTGVSAGTVTISYTSSTGCVGTIIVTVTAPTAAITGTLSVCMGSTTMLSHTTTGGTWSSSNGSVATISMSGVVTSVATGTATISYTLPSTEVITAVVTVNANPAAITGTASVCMGNITGLENATTGGTWSSSATGVATIDTYGIVTPVAAGNATITYMLSTGCYATATVTVHTTPTAIVGTASVCEGATTTLNVATGGGSWSSSDMSIATVGSTNGVVTGGSGGSVVISYVLPTGCFSAVIVTVNALPAAITGTMSACIGATALLSSATTGGTWTSSNTAVATIDGTTGVYTGVAAGLSAITYTLSTGCRATATITVNTSPAAITGTQSVCVGLTTNLASATTGGTWSSSDMSVATIGTSGTVTGMAAGTATITYSTGSGCTRTAEVTVNALPDAITGTQTVCVGLTTTLINTSTGGTWSGTSTTIANISPTTGVVTGVATGTAVFTYTIATGCKVTAVVTVNSAPAAIMGTMKACPGTTTALTNATSGGTWSSADNSIATVGTSGVVTGVAAGTVNISYETGAGCYRVTLVTINAAPAAIAGTLAVCIGSTTSLSSATTGGVSWMSSNTAVATVNSSTGVVSGVAAGTATITYTLGSGCIATAVVTASSLPAITGVLKACPGTTTALAGSPAGGAWTSSNTAVASIDGTTGVATGIATGTTTITYSLGGGCAKTAIMTVNPNPGAITGYMIACVGTNTTLTGTGGGTWSSSDLAVGTVGLSTGIVRGVSPGTTTISYTLSTGCFRTAEVTVNSVPPAITGTASICSGTTTTLANSLAGGTWSSSNATAIVGSATGIVTAMGSSGTTTISYNFGVNCRATTIVTVKALPATIGGTLNVCVGAVTTLSNVTSGGTWSSSNAGIATVGTGATFAYGAVTGISAGTAGISYTVTSTGCSRVAIVTVNPAPNAGTITGATFNINTITPPTSVTLSSTGDAGGAWTSSTPAVATVDGTGLVSAVSAGTTTISYTVTLGSCTARATQVISVAAARPGGSTATGNVAGQVQIDIFPNPTTGTFSVKSDEAGTFTVFTIDGKEVMTYDVTPGITEVVLPGHTAAGVYMCRFNGSKGASSAIRLIKE